MIIALISAILRLGVTAFCVFLITRLGHILNARERWGAGFMGGCGFLTIPVILDVDKAGTPFDTVAGLAFSFGCCLFFWGYIDRKLSHERRNAEQVKHAKEHFAGKAV